MAKNENRATLSSASIYVNYPKAKEKATLSTGANKNNGSPLEYLGGNLGLGLAGIVEGAYDFVAGGLSSVFGGEQGNRYAAYLFNNNYTSDLTAKLNEQYNPGKVMQFAGEAAQGIGQSSVFYLNAGVPYLGTALFFAGAAGNSVAEAVQKTGQLGWKEYGYGVTSGAIEAALETISGVAGAGIGRAGKTLTGKIGSTLGKLSKDTATSAVRNGVVKSVISGAASEFFEEFLGAYAETAAQHVFQIDPNAEYSFSDAVYAGLVGAASGGIMEGVQTSVRATFDHARGTKIINNGKAQNLVNTVKVMQDEFKSADWSKYAGNEKATGVMNDLIAAYQAYQKLDESQKTSDRAKVYLGEMESNLAVLEAAVGAMRMQDDIRAHAENYVDWVSKYKAEKFTAEDIRNDRDGVLRMLAVAKWANLFNDSETVGQRKERWINEQIAAQAAKRTAEATGEAAAPVASSILSTAGTTDSGIEWSENTDGGITTRIYDLGGDRSVYAEQHEDGTWVLIAGAGESLLDEDGVNLATRVKTENLDKTVTEIRNNYDTLVSDAEKRAAEQVENGSEQVENKAESGQKVQNEKETERAPKTGNVVKGLSSVQYAGEADLKRLAGFSAEEAAKRTIKSNLTLKQKATAILLGKWFEHSGYKLMLYKGTGTGATGAYKAGHIFLDVNASMLQIVAHELTHSFVRKSPALYGQLRQFVIDREFGGDESKLNEAVKNITDLYKKNGTVLEREDAIEEIVAKSCEKVFGSVAALKELFGKNKQLFKEANSFLHSMEVTFQSVYDGYGEGNEYARAMEEDITALHELREKFAEALQEAMKDETAGENEAEKKLFREINKEDDLGVGEIWRDENGDLTVAQNVDGDKTFFSITTYEEYGRRKLAEVLKENGFGKEDIRATLSSIDRMSEFLEDLADRYQDTYGQLKGNLYATLATDITGTRQVLSTLVKNGEYPVNLDLQLICKKRVAYMKLMARLLDDGVFGKVKYDGEAIAKVNQILSARGYETACLGCFVESRRQQLQKWAETIAQEWNDEVKRVNKDAGYFPFVSDSSAEISGEELMQVMQEYEGKQKNAKGNLNLGKGGVKTKMRKLLSQIPSLAHLITADTLLTPDGLKAIQRTAGGGDMLSLIKQRYGAASPKLVQEFNPYNSEIADLSFQSAKKITGDGITGAAEYEKAAKEKLAASEPKKQKGESESDFRARKQAWDSKVTDLAMTNYLYDIGGARIQSFSDFMIENVFDYFQIMGDLAARGFPLHGYTKEIVCARLFGQTGAKWNGSLIAHVSADQEYAGLMSEEQYNKLKKNGKIPAGLEAIRLEGTGGRVWYMGFDDYARHAADNNAFIQSIGMKDIMALVLDPRYSGNVGNITIGVSDEQIIAMLRSPYFRMVIPYHASGMLPEFAKLVGTDRYTDYTNYQNTRIDKLYDLDRHAVESFGEDAKTDLTGYNFNARLRELGDAKKVADEYISWCRDQLHPVYVDGEMVGYATYAPKFSGDEKHYDFTQEENYYKLLEDFDVYNAIDELAGKKTAAPQGPVNLILPGEGKGRNLSEAELKEYRQRLSDVGIYSESDINKILERANWTAEQIIEHELASRSEYQKYADANWEDTVAAVEDALEIRSREEGFKTYKQFENMRKKRPESLVNYEPVKGTYKVDATKLSVTEDADGDALSEGQVKFFERSKVRNKEGKLIKVYHGTANGGRFTVFDAKKLNNSKLSSHIGQGFYFTNNERGAREYMVNTDIYGNVSKGTDPNLFSGYLNIENPLYISESSRQIDYKTIRDIVSNGDNEWFFNSGMAHELQNKEIGGKKYSRQEIKDMSLAEKISLYSSYLAQFGDMTALNNFVDAYKYNSQDKLLKAMQVYLGNDGIIWEMRDGIAQYVVFNSNQFKNSDNINPTKDQDIRYSYSEDSDGDSLSESQIMFFGNSKIRDEEGKLIKVYHGTDADFTVFDRTKGRSNMDIQGSFFSPWEIDAAGYGPNVRAFYLNITNPAPEGVAYKVLNRYKGQNNAGIKARETLERMGYDGVNNSDEEYIAFYPEQIKLVDNTTPTEDEDVRYSFAGTAYLTEERVDSYLKDYAIASSPSKSKAWIGHFDPKEFTPGTSYLLERFRVSKETEELDPQKLKDESQPIFLDVDLDSDGKPIKIVGHEGRHRSTAMSREGIWRAPVILFDSEWKENRSNYSKLHISGQTSESSPIFVYDLIPLDYSHRDEIIKTFSELSANDKMRERYGTDVLRYSFTEEDEAYSKAVEEGNERRQEQLVKQAAERAGYTTPKLYHGTRYFGFTQFKPREGAPFIFTSTDRTVSANYAGDRHYAGVRQIGTKFRSSDKLSDIIANAKSIWGTEYKQATTGDRRRAFQTVIDEAAEVAEKMDKLRVDMPDTMTDEEINAVAWMENLMWQAQGVKNGDVENYFELSDESERKSYRDEWAHDIEMFEKDKPIVQKYLEDNLDRLTKDQLKYLRFLLGYDVGDAAIDLQYTLQRAISDGRILARSDGALANADELQASMEEIHNIGSYELYGNLGDNPLTVDAESHDFFAIKVPEMGDDLYHDSDAVAKWAKENGYTSLIIKNVYDYGNKADDYVFFDTNQVKSADNITYDDDGNVIPLSERFKSDTDDIRYSITEPVDLSESTELQRRIRKSKTSVTKTISDYVLEKLGGQTITFSDGRQAVVDKSDANHLAQRSSKQKQAELSSIQKIIQRAKYVGETDRVTHNKFNYFYYYKTLVKYGDETYDLYINVGKAKNDGTNHLYEINHWTQNEKEKISAGLTKSIPISTKSSPTEDVPLESKSREDIPAGAGKGKTHINRADNSIPQPGDSVNTEKTKKSISEENRGYTAEEQDEARKYVENFDLLMPEGRRSVIEFLRSAKGTKVDKDTLKVISNIIAVSDNLDVRFADTEQKGVFIRGKSGQQLILLDSKLESAEAIRKTLSAEMIHMAEEGGEGYEKFARLVLAVTPPDRQEEVEKKYRDFWKQSGKEITDEALLHECVSELGAEMIEDYDLVEKWAARDKTFVGKLLASARSLARSLFGKNREAYRQASRMTTLLAEAIAGSDGRRGKAQISYELRGQKTADERKRRADLQDQARVVHYFTKPRAREILTGYMTERIAPYFTEGSDLNISGEMQRDFTAPAAEIPKNAKLKIRGLDAITDKFYRAFYTADTSKKAREAASDIAADLLDRVVFEGTDTRAVEAIKTRNAGIAATVRRGISDAVYDALTGGEAISEIDKVRTRYDNLATRILKEAGVREARLQEEIANARGETRSMLQAIEQISRARRQFKEGNYRYQGTLAAPEMRLLSDAVISAKTRGGFLDPEKARRALIAFNEVFRIDELKSDLNEEYEVLGMNVDTLKDLDYLVSRMVSDYDTKRDDLMKAPLTQTEIETFADVARAVAQLYRTYNRYYDERRKAWIDADETAKRGIENVEQTMKLQQTDPKIIQQMRKIMNDYGIELLDPLAVSKLLDGYAEDGVMTEIITDIMNAENAKTLRIQNYMREVDEFIKSTKGFEKHLTDEKDMIEYRGQKLTRDEFIQLYMTTFRKQALLHLGLGRMEFGTNGSKYGMRVIAPFLQVVENATGSTDKVDTPSIEDLQSESQKVVSEIRELGRKVLTADDKKYIELMEKFYNEVSTKDKSETDYKYFGMTNVIEDDTDKYVPIVTSSSSRASSITDERTAMLDFATLSGQSFNKNTIKGAKNPLSITGAYGLMQKHANGLAAYVELYAPMQKLDRIWSTDINHNKQDSKRLRDTIKNAYGNRTEDYIRTLMGDIQGINKRRPNAFNSILAKLRSNYAIFQLGANPKTWFNQLGSMGALYRFCDLDSIMKGIKPTNLGDMSKFSTAAAIREDSDVAVKAQSLTENVSGKVKDIMMKPIGWSDMRIVGMSWGACQYQIQKEKGYAVGSEANMKAAGELLNKVINESQDTSMASTKTGIARSDNEIIRSLAMFRSAPFKQYSRMTDAIGTLTMLNAKKKAGIDVSDDAIRNAKKELARTGAGWALQAAIGVAITSLFHWLYDKDDEIKTKDVAIDFASEMLSVVPILGDVVGYFASGYDMSLWAFDIMNDGMQSLSGTAKLIGRSINGDNISRQDINKQIYTDAQALGEITGIPVRNVKNALFGLTKRASSLLGSSIGYELDATMYKKSYQADLQKAIESGNDALAEKIVELLYADKKTTTEASEAAVSEVVRLYGEGFTDALPPTLSDTITVDGVEYTVNAKDQKRIRSIANEADPAVVSMIGSKIYQGLEDSEKAKAIKDLYRLYYDRALADVYGKEMTKNDALTKLTDPETLLAASAHIAGISADKNAEGKSISGSRKAKVLEYLNSLDIDDETAYLILYAAGYSSQDLQKEVSNIAATAPLDTDTYTEVFAALGLGSIG